MWKILFVCFFVCAVTATGTLHTDEITGYTDIPVSIPYFSADNLVSTFLTLERIDATFPEGFDLNTVGGISFQLDGPIDISTPGNLNFGTTVGGDVAVQANHTVFSSGDDLSFLTANGGIIDAFSDIEFTVPNGTLDFNSNFGTTVAAAEGAVLSSSAGELRLVAPRGDIRFHGDNIGFASAAKGINNTISFQSQNDFVVSADREINTLAEKEITVTAGSRLVISSKYGGADFESAEFLGINAGSNVVLSASAGFTLETLLGDIRLFAKQSTSLYAQTLKSKAQATTLSSGGQTFLESTGNAHFFAIRDVAFNSRLNSTISAFDFVKFTGRSDSPILFDLNALTSVSSNVFVEAANVPGDGISFEAGALTFLADQANIHTDAELISFSAAAINVNSTNDFYLGVSPKLVSFPGFFQEGSLDWETQQDLTIESKQTLTLNADNVIDFSDETSFKLQAGDYITVDTAQKSVYVALDVLTFTAGTAVDFYSAFGQSFLASLNGDINFSTTTYQSESRFSHEIDTNTLQINANDVVFQSLTGSTHLEARGVFSLTASNDIELIANNFNDQQTIIHVGTDSVWSGNSVTFDSDTQSLSFAVPSGSAAFKADGSIVSKLGYGSYKSLSDSIQFQQGVMDVTGGEGIYFRSGQASQVTVTEDATFTSGDTLIASETGINMGAPEFQLDSKQSAQFLAHFVALFEGDTISWTTSEFVANGGEIGVSSHHVEFNGGKFSISSDNNNNIEFDSGSLTINSAKDVKFASDYFTLTANDDSSFTQTSALFQSTVGDFAIRVFGAEPNTAEFDSKNTNVQGDSFRLTSLPHTSDFFFQGAPIDLNANTNAVFETNGAFNFEADGDFALSGFSGSFKFIENQQETPSDYDVDGNTLYKTCAGDFQSVSGEFRYFGKAGGLTISQIVDPCGDCEECEPGDFTIVSHGLNQQNFTVTSASLKATNDLQVTNGRALFEAEDELSIISGEQVSFTSLNLDSFLTDEQPDYVQAGEDITVNAENAISLVTNGYSGDSIHALSPENTPGFQLELIDGDLLFNAPNDAIRFSAPDQNINLYSDENLYIENINDLILYGGQGSVVLTAGALFDAEFVSEFIPVSEDDDLLQQIEFWLRNGDLLVQTSQASIAITSAQEQYVESLQGLISFTAGVSFNHTATEIDGRLEYNTLLGEMTIEVGSNISLTAGTNVLDADVIVSATRDVGITTLYEQRYVATGPSSREQQNSIILVGEEGPVSITTPADQQIYSSGKAWFFSKTGLINITAQGDVSAIARGELHLNSTLDSTVSVSNGNIFVAAHGGGGSVDFISDADQSITGVASQNVRFRSEDTANFHAQTGFNAVTQLGDISFTQTGVDQNTMFHSEGSILLQADRQDGIYFQALSTTGKAGGDILFDTAQWRVGSTQNTDISTKPNIGFHAGGDFSVAGITFDVTGGMKWSTNKVGPVTFFGNRAQFDAAGNIDLTANGFINLENRGADSNNLAFVVTAGGLLTLDAGDAVELTANRSALLTAPNAISFASTGDLPNDLSLIDVDNNWLIQTTTLQTTTDTLEAEVQDMYISADGSILIQNTVGDGGSLTFDSDWSLDAYSIGPMSFSADGITTISTYGAYSDIQFLSNQDLTLSSGGAITIGSETSSISAPAGVMIKSTADDVEFVGSGDLTVKAEGALTFNGVESVTIESGYYNTDNDLLSSPITITSRGAFESKAVTEVVFQTLDRDQDLRVVSDRDMFLANRLPTRSSDQGDIRVDSPGSLYTRSGHDTILRAGRDLEFDVKGSTQIESTGEMSFVATASGASVFVEASDTLTFNAYDELIFAAKTSLTASASGSFTWNQINDDGVGGISIGASNGKTTVNAPEGVTFNGALSISGSAPYLLFQSASDITLRSVSYGGDVMFQTLNDQTLLVQTGADITIGNTDRGMTNVVKIVSDPHPTTRNSQININTKTIQVNTEFFHDSIWSGENFTLTNPDVGTADMTFTAGNTVAIVAHGTDSTSRFGIEIETDDTITFSSTENIELNANLGAIIANASETFTVRSGTDIDVSSGASILISTGFTPEPLWQVPERTGILFASTGNAAFRSNKDDVRFFGEDSSWSIADGSLQVINRGETISAHTLDSPITWSGTEWNSHSRNAELVADDIIINNAVSTSFLSYGSTTLYSWIDMDILSTQVSFNAEEQILFATPYGSVDVSDTTFVIPPLFKQGGISGHNYNLAYDTTYFNIATGDIYRNQEENQYPGCEERAFGWDRFTNALCYCDFNKWRCIDSIVPAPIP